MEDWKNEDIVEIASDGDPELAIITIYANSRGLKRFATQLIDAANKLDNSDRISFGNPANPTDSFMPSNIVIQNINSPKMPVFKEEKWLFSKLKQVGNIIGVLLLVLIFFVGVITIIVGLIDILFF